MIRRSGLICAAALVALLPAAGCAPPPAPKCSLLDSAAGIATPDQQATDTERIAAGINRVFMGSVVSNPRPGLSADGRYVAFSSDASSLVEGDSNDETDVFRFDRLTNEIVRVSLDLDGDELPAGGSSPSISADGNVVAFGASQVGFGGVQLVGRQLLRRDVPNGVTSLITVPVDTSPNVAGSDASLSADGRFVSFTSSSTNLVPGPTYSIVSNVYLRDHLSDSTVRVSSTPNGGPGGNGSNNSAISGDGSLVVFRSTANNLVASPSSNSSDLYLYDSASTTLRRLSSGSNCEFGAPSISADGAHVVVPVASPPSPTLAPSYPGRLVAIDTVDGSVTQLPTATPAEPADTRFAVSAVSGDGSRVLYRPIVRNDGRQPAYVLDRATGTTTVLAMLPEGSPASPGDATLSDDGSTVAFTSAADGLVPGDDDGSTDVFVQRIPD